MCPTFILIATPLNLEHDCDILSTLLCMGSEYKTDVVCCKVTIAAQNKESATHVLHETRKLQSDSL